MNKPIKHHTAAAIILTTATPRKILLVHHKKLGKWLQPGGHQEPWENPIETAIRETQEETGLDISPYIENVTKLGEQANNIPVPSYILEERVAASEKEPAHRHIDMQYVVHVPEQAVNHQAKEAHGIGWFTREELETLDTFDEARRIFNQELTA